MDLDIEVFFGGAWHDAAVVGLDSPDMGYVGSADVSYDPRYFIKHAALDFGEDRFTGDIRAVSVNYPVDLVNRYTDRWPAFLLDMIPQGHARRKLAQVMKLDENARSSDLPLLLRSAGHTVGNLRVSQAYAQERERLHGIVRVGVTEDDILDKSDRFNEVVDRFAMLASGSSGLQGEWPKVAMTLAADGLYYPDPLVEDSEAEGHYIVKLLRSNKEADLDILSGEAVYSAVAEKIGLNVSGVSSYRNGALMIPRFDRAFRDGRLVRNGQESFVSALGISEFGYVGTHEAYIDMLKRFSSQPFEDIAEYVKRDIANLALGNSDNHGRNTAMGKYEDGSIGLTPLYDFAPMKLAPETVMRSTNWECMRCLHRQANPDWRVVCDTIFPGGDEADRLMQTLIEFGQVLEHAPKFAEELGAGRNIARAMRACEQICQDLAIAPAHKPRMI